jgi:plasmid stabilization system protein ParE
MRVRFGEWAKLEFDEAKSWYALIRPELGRLFADEVRSAAKRMGPMPLLYPPEVGGIRKCVLSRFPYTLRYALRDGGIVIVAVSHQHRAPDYWVPEDPNG